MTAFEREPIPNQQTLQPGIEGRTQQAGNPFTADVQLPIQIDMAPNVESKADFRESLQPSDVYVAWIHSQHEEGGQPVYIRDSVRALQAAGVNNLVLTTREFKDWDGVPYAQVPIAPEWANEYHPDGKLKEKMSKEEQYRYAEISAWSAAARIYDEFQKSGAKSLILVGNHADGTMIAARARQIIAEQVGIYSTLVGIPHSLGVYKRELTPSAELVGYPTAVRELLEEHFYTEAAASGGVVSYAQFDVDYLEAMGIENNIKIPPALKLGQFNIEGDHVTDREAVRRHVPQLGENERYILSSGRMSGQKNHELNMKAFATLAEEYTDVKLVIVGGGESPADKKYRQGLVAMAEELGIADRVHIRAAIAHHDLPALFREASAFGIMSRYDAFNLMVAEAAGCGTPLVVSKHMGATSALQEYDRTAAEVVDVHTDDSVAQTADAYRLILSDPLQAKAMGLRAREWALTLTSEANTANFWRFFKNIAQPADADVSDILARAYQNQRSEESQIEEHQYWESIRAEARAQSGGDNERYLRLLDEKMAHAIDTAEEQFGVDGIEVPIPEEHLSMRQREIILSPAKWREKQKIDSDVVQRLMKGIHTLEVKPGEVIYLERNADHDRAGILYHGAPNNVQSSSSITPRR